MPIDQLDLQAVAKADERFWAKHPELHKRALTSDPSDARYRPEWLKLYEQAEQESAIPAPSVLPKPVPPPPPVNATSPVQACPGVASMTHEEKIEAAIHSANLGQDVLRELGDIKALATTMVIVGGGLAVAGVAAAATGVGLLVEGVAAVGAGLLVAGAAMSGWQIGQGLTSLYDFFQQTRCDTATTPAQLLAAGKKFGEGIAKVGIGTVNLLLALLGGRGENWRGQPLTESKPPLPRSPTRVGGPTPPPYKTTPMKGYKGEDIPGNKFWGTPVTYLSENDRLAPAYTVVSARHHMLWPATVRRIDVPACVWVCCASLGGVLGPSRTAGTGGPHHPGTWLLSRPNFASSFASFWSNTTCWGLLKQPYKQKVAYKLEFKDGKIYDASGKLFDTTDAATLHSGDGRAIFVMDENGNFYASKFQRKGYFHHSSLVSGEPVAVAGEIKVENGVLKVISDKSGHYRLEQSFTQQAVDALQRRGIDMTKVQPDLRGH